MNAAKTVKVDYYNKLIAVTIFLSAFLLFQVQPMMGKHLLPYFGGSSAVWIVCLVFFTGTLFAGYLYSFLLNKRPLRFQLYLHGIVILVLISAQIYHYLVQHWTSPILPTLGVISEASIPNLLLVLLYGIGIPFFLLATTSTLLQTWYAYIRHQESPYYLYSVSNIGSILGLLSYPLLFEYVLSKTQQSLLWSVSFGLYALLMATVLIMNLRLSPSAHLRKTATIRPATDRPSLKSRVSWIFLAMLAAMTMLVVTDLTTKGISSFPLNWILPLLCYLISFVIAFKISIRILHVPLSILSLLSILYILILNDSPGDIFSYLLFANGIVFCVGLLCHSLIYETRPATTSHIPLFYLLISFGGALGSFLVGIIFPGIFNNYYEIGIILGVVIFICAHILWMNPDFFLLLGIKETVRNHFKFGIFFAVLVGLTTFYCGKSLITQLQSQSYRNFFGVAFISSSIRAVPASPEEAYTRVKVLNNGHIVHGLEIIGDPDSGKKSYYSPLSGIGTVLTYYQDHQSTINTGIVGLGAGMLSAYMRNQDKMVYYEIDPKIISIAQDEFSYLQKARGEISVILGDARLTMARDLENNPRHRFDVLLMDAFNDDAIPVHLLTREAFTMYLDSIAEDGTIIFHISNRYLDLLKVLIPLAVAHEMPYVLVRNTENPKLQLIGSQWVVMTRNQALIDYMQDLEQPNTTIQLQADQKYTKGQYFTDEYNYILPLLKF